MKVISFAGRKRAGKGVLAEYCQRKYNGVILSFASPIKHLCAELMDLSYDELNALKNDLKPILVHPDDRWYDKLTDELHPYVKKLSRTSLKSEIKSMLDRCQIGDARQLLQVIGTDIIRHFYNDWHVMKTEEAIRSYKDSDTCVIIDDMRFPNELAMVRKYTDLTYFVIRPSYLSDVSNHISETSLSHDMFPDSMVIVNDLSLACLYADFESRLSGAGMCERKHYEKVSKCIFLESESPIERKRFVNILKDTSALDMETGCINLTKLSEADRLRYEPLLLNGNVTVGFDYIYNPFLIEDMKRYL